MIKSLIRPVLVTLCLTVLICWLFVKSRQSNHGRYDEFSQLLTVISRLDAEINAEVLKLEFNLHKSYDRLTELEQNFTECTGAIDRYATFAFDDSTSSRSELVAPMARKLQLVADFKSLHAVLENSLAIFYRSGRQLTSLETDPHVAQIQGDLLHIQKDGMELVLHDSERGRHELQECIDRASQWPLEANSQADRHRKVMLAHARNLLKAKPQMDALLVELNELGVAESLRALHENATRVYSKASRRAASYQVQLLSAALLLIGYCGYSVYSISRYVKTIRLTNEKLEERVRARTNELEAKGEVLRSNGRFLASVLDSLDAKICILDAEGTINATNAVWDAHSDNPAWLASGSNYLNAFRSDARTVFGAPQVAQALERMRTAQVNTLIVEYDTNYPSEPQQWIQARINKMPIGPNRFLGFVVALIDITDRIRAEADKDKLNRQLQALSRQAGMAEVATGVLHNVGNVLNSINTASSQATRIVRSSRLASLHKAEQLVQEHLHDFATFVSEDPRGQQLPKYISQIAKTWEEEQTQLLSELAELTRHIEHVKHVVNVQQEHAKLSTVTQEVQLTLLIEDAITTIAPTLKSTNIALQRELQQLPMVKSDPHKIMQILVNLLSNAKHAVQDSKAPHPCILIRSEVRDEQVLLSVTDNGIGIAPEHLARICQHGFTTKKNGHGFGLHSCALLAKELGGELHFDSPGLNQGATFTLALPICQPQNAAVPAPC